MQFGGGDNSILNNGAFNLRHFADTNGDGVRDTVRVALANLGTNASNSFTNNGTLALAEVTGAGTLDRRGSISRSHVNPLGPLGRLRLPVGRQCRSSRPEARLRPT